MKSIEFYIDRGGTFTDIVYCVSAEDGGSGSAAAAPRSFSYGTYKLLSRDPEHYPDAPSEGIRRILIKEGLLSGQDNDREGGLIPTTHISSIKMGTTVATNALLEHNGAPCALFVTKGFEDCLVIGNQSRPHIFKLDIVKNSMLYSEIVEVEERLRLVPAAEESELCRAEAGINFAEKSSALVGTRESEADEPRKFIRGPSGLLVEEVAAVDVDKARSALQTIYDKGIRSVAISFMHSYAYGGHEKVVAELAREIGFTQISVSHELMPLIKYVSRTTTATVDAYLTPLIAEYVSNFRTRFQNNLDDIFDKVYFIQSDGGLTKADRFYGFQAVLSGPAGGVVGCGATACSDLGEGSQVIGFDMGGTSTDVCRCDGRTIDHVMEATISGVSLQAPQVNVVTVAAGGGSVLFWSNGMFEVGPESAGAYPGPACYGRGGPLAVTDANVILGRVDPRRFPNVFGASGREPLFVDAARTKFEEMTAKINADLKQRHEQSILSSPSSSSPEEPDALQLFKPLTVEEVAVSFLEVANETMCRAIRNVTETKGYRCAEHTLSVFGGAGGQHACAVARKLGMNRIYAHQKASYLSAVGIGMSDIVDDRLTPLRKPLVGSADVIVAMGRQLIEEAANVLAPAKTTDNNSKSIDTASLIEDGTITVQKFLSLRYEGTTTALMIREPTSASEAIAMLQSLLTSQSASSVSNEAHVYAKTIEEAYRIALEEQYQQEFGFPGKKGARILVDEVRIRASVSSGAGQVFGARPPTVPHPLGPTQGYEAPYGLANVDVPMIDTIKTYVSGGRSSHEWRDVPIYQSTANGKPIDGPCLLMMDGTFMVVEERCQVFFTNSGNVVVHAAASAPKLTRELHPLPLSLFAHRFMSIAEQMGYTLQRTASSTNIKERLDFSCAVFDGIGGLVANAPHIPVHLGAMGATIRWQRELYGEDGWKEGEVLLSNHPSAGGSHLPDITVMTPCFIDGKCAFYVASRGHHADVGGITPGSMPPFSNTLDDEGAHIKSFKLVKDGVFQEEGITELLMAPGKRGTADDSNNKSSGCRMLSDVLADLRAQVAANHRGIELMKSLVASYGLDVVEAYMGHIQDAAENATRAALKEVVRRAKTASSDSANPHHVPHKHGVHTSAISVHKSSDVMDDGTLIALTLTINKEEGSAVFDFSESGPQVLGSTNCPRAVAASAVIYSLRCLIERDIPLNEGCLKPVTIITKPHSILDPSEDCAVVAGNVLTSQRVTDVILRALYAAACSQGCMNNLTMGNAKLAYYETIGGGSGATATANGADAVQVHMTNTRMTDAEVFEERYPVMLRRYAVRHGSGGEGVHKGGNGIVRSMLFLSPMSLSLSTERRAVAPKGFLGGGDGKPGLNLLLRGQKPKTFGGAEEEGANEKKCRPITSSNLWSDEGFLTYNVGGKCTLQLSEGDVVVVHTPGGGGYGAVATRI